MCSKDKRDITSVVVFTDMPLGAPHKLGGLIMKAVPPISLG